MKFIGNIIWLLLGGILCAILWFIAGILVCITIVGIPFGVQCFKIARFVLWPFGTNVDIGNFGFGGAIGNILWIIIFGWELAVVHFFVAIIFSVTIIGIPFGIQHFKFAKLAFLPFGANLK